MISMITENDGEIEKSRCAGNSNMGGWTGDIDLLGSEDREAIA